MQIKKRKKKMKKQTNQKMQIQKKTKLKNLSNQNSLDYASLSLEREGDQIFDIRQEF